MAEQKQLPAFIGTIHRKFFTPYVSILITAGLMLFLTLKSSFLAALTISTIARLVTYAATCISLPVFRARPNTPPATFRVPGGTIIAILALLLIIWLLMNSTLAEAKSAAWAAGIGLLIYFSYRLYSGRA
jgi:amino acid transporter